MEHFKRLAFCMLYLFTFIWQLSAQVKKIPQWGAVRDSVARYCQRKSFCGCQPDCYFLAARGDTVNVQGFYDGDGRYVIRFML